MHAVIAIFYGLFTWLLAVVYTIIAYPDLTAWTLVMGPFIASGMTLALLALDGLVILIERGVRRLATLWQKSARTKRKKGVTD